MKKKIIFVIAGVAGLAMAYFLVSGISHIIYNRPTDNAGRHEVNGDGRD